MVTPTARFFHGGPDHDADAKGQQSVGSDLRLAMKNGCNKNGHMDKHIDKMDLIDLINIQIKLDR